MGHFTRLKTTEIWPREIVSSPKSDIRFLYLAQLIECYLEGINDHIPPPVVKRNKKGWVAVDGHNRLLVADLFLGDTEVYVPESANDGFLRGILPGVSPFMLRDLNDSISRAFDAADRVNYLDGESFADIRSQRPDFYFLRDITSAKSFYERWRHISKTC